MNQVLIGRRAVLLTSVAFPFIAGAQSSNYPNRPVRLIVPYAPGGVSDTLARLFGARMSELLGQPFVVDNRTGANTSIGAEAVLRSAPDGYTLLFANDSTFVINPILSPSLPYNMQRDFAPICAVSYAAMSVVVHADTPVNNMKELAAYVKGRKDLSYASFGMGSQPHLLGEMFSRLAGSELIHVPYKGGSPAVGAVLGKQVLLTFAGLPSVSGQVAAGRLKALAVTGNQRLASMPTVPTLTEQGFKEMDLGSWLGFVAPVGTQREVVDRLNSTINAVLADRNFVEKNLAGQGMVPMGGTPDQMASLIRGEAHRIGEYVKKSGAKLD